jgi:hypothetical protein
LLGTSSAVLTGIWAKFFIIRMLHSFLHAKAATGSFCMSGDPGNSAISRRMRLDKWENSGSCRASERGGYSWKWTPPTSYADRPVHAFTGPQQYQSAVLTADWIKLRIRTETIQILSNATTTLVFHKSSKYSKSLKSSCKILWNESFMQIY